MGKLGCNPAKQWNTKILPSAHPMIIPRLLPSDSIPFRYSMTVGRDVAKVGPSRHRAFGVESRQDELGNNNGILKRSSPFSMPSSESILTISRERGMNHSYNQQTHSAHRHCRCHCQKADNFLRNHDCLTHHEIRRLTRFATNLEGPIIRS